MKHIKASTEFKARFDENRNVIDVDVTYVFIKTFKDNYISRQHKFPSISKQQSWEEFSLSINHRS